MKLLDQKCCLNSKGESIAILFDRIDHTYCKDTCPHAVFRECELAKS